MQRHTYSHQHQQQQLQQYGYQPHQRSHSLDDEDNDNLSCRSHFSSFSIPTNALHNETESIQAHVSVRDMIRRYNSNSKTGSKLLPPVRRQSQHALPTAKSSYFGVNKFGSQTNVRQYVTQLDDQQNTANKTEETAHYLNDTGLIKCTNEHCCQHGNRRNSIKSLNFELNHNNNNNNQNGSFGKDFNNELLNRHSTSSSTRLQSLELQDGTDQLKSTPSTEKLRIPTADSMEHATFEPIESSYQSKTTIAKTSSGVRIIIDILFDQDQTNVSTTDVIGSRVETDIPHSRILNEFQQQALAAAAASVTAPSKSAET